MRSGDTGCDEFTHRKTRFEVWAADFDDDTSLEAWCIIMTDVMCGHQSEVELGIK